MGSNIRLLGNRTRLKIGIPSLIFSLALIFSLGMILSYNNIAHAQQITSLQAFQQSDNLPIPEFSNVQPTDIRFDYTADQSVNFLCTLSLVNEDLSGTVTKVELNTLDCGTGSTQGSILYNKELFQANGNNGYEFTVSAIGSSPIVQNRTFIFAIVGGCDIGTTTGAQASNIQVDQFWKNMMRWDLLRLTIKFRVSQIFTNLNLKQIHL